MSVQVFESTDVGAPVLSGSIGALLSLLDACLVTGYGSSAITSITRSGSVATVTKTAHGYRKHNRITISGATQTEYNGTFRVESVIDANTFTYNVTGTPATPATGSPVSMKTGAGWTKPYTGTNIAAFKQPASLASPMFFEVNDTNTQYGLLRGYETMTASVTGTGLFPTTAQRTTGGVGLWKSQTADATARPWVLICNGGTVWMWTNTNTSSDGTGGVLSGWGDCLSYKSADAYNKFVIGNGWTGSSQTTPSSTYHFAPNLSIAMGQAAPTDHYMARSYTQSGTAIQMTKISDAAKANGQTVMGCLGTNALTYPHPVDSGLYIAPVWFYEASSYLLRGEAPGLWNMLHNSPLTVYDTFTGLAALPGKEFMALRCMPGGNQTSQNCSVVFEISDTW